MCVWMGGVGREISLYRLFLVASSCPVQYAKQYAINYNHAFVSQHIILSLFSVIQKQLFSLFWHVAYGSVFLLKTLTNMILNAPLKLLHRDLIKLDENHDQLKRNRTKPNL